MRRRRNQAKSKSLRTFQELVSNDIVEEISVLHEFSDNVNMRESLAVVQKLYDSFVVHDLHDRSLGAIHQYYRWQEGSLLHEELLLFVFEFCLLDDFHSDISVVVSLVHLDEIRLRTIKVWRGLTAL